jgi:hypothetical protein
MLMLLLILAFNLPLVVAAVVAGRSLLDHLLRAEQGTAFLMPVFIPSPDGMPCLILAGLLQIRRLARGYRSPPSSQEEKI